MTTALPVAGLWLLLAAPARTAQAPSLETVAASSARPEPCRPASERVESGFWSQARGVGSEAFCAKLARGYARLDGDPATALELAHAARRLAPAQAKTALLLEGRALARLARWEQAYAALAGARPPGASSAGGVAALRELGVAAVMTGHTDAAIEAYRALLPQSSVLLDRVFSRVASLEAAGALLLSGPAGLAEAELYLSEARRRASVPGFEDLTLALSALVLDRAGAPERAELLRAELGGPWSLERFATARDRARLARATLEGVPERAEDPPALDELGPMLADGELHAAIGVVALGRDAGLARAHLRAYLASPGGRGPWAAWARSRLESLGRR